MNPPNILVIMADQMRADALGCNGNPVIRTPNIDFLARTGVNFPVAYTPNPICVPGRACMATGSYPHKCTGVKANSGAVKEGFPLLAGELGRRGYATYAIGKLHYNPYLGPGEGRTTLGFQHTEITESGRLVAAYGGAKGLEEYIDYLDTVGWGGYSRGTGVGNNDIFPVASPLPEEHCVDSWIAARSIANMRKHLDETPDRPFFMFASFPKPHSPYDPPRLYDAMYDPREIPPPVGRIEDIQSRGLYLLIESYHQHGWGSLSPAAKQTIKAAYYGLISFQDKQIGRLLDFLRERDILDDTIILYTADHGDMMGDFGLFFKRVMYQGAVNIPFILRYPKVLPRGLVSRELPGLQDVLPTLLGFTGAPLQALSDGLDITPHIISETPLRPFFVSQCNDGSQQRYMLADQAFKYIYHVYGGAEELYDLANDPGELVNLAAAPEHRDRIAHMRAQLIAWCEGNEDHAIIKDGKLAFETPFPAQAQPRQNAFGRRHW